MVFGELTFFYWQRVLIPISFPVSVEQILKHHCGCPFHSCSMTISRQCVLVLPHLTAGSDFFFWSLILGSIQIERLWNGSLGHQVTARKQRWEGRNNRICGNFVSMHVRLFLCVYIYICVHFSVWGGDTNSCRCWKLKQKANCWRSSVSQRACVKAEAWSACRSRPYSRCISKLN